MTAEADCYVTRQGSTVALTGILDRGLCEEIAVNRSAINPGVTYEIHFTNGHAGRVVATATDGRLAPAATDGRLAPAAKAPRDFPRFRAEHGLPC